MAGFPPGSRYPYGVPPPYGASPPHYGVPPPPPPPPHQHDPYAVPYAAGDKPPKLGKASSVSLFGKPSAPPAYGYGGEKPPKEGKYHDAAPGYAPHGGGGAGAGRYGYPAGGFANPFASLVPQSFPPGTDPNVVACFQAADRDGSGFIDDKELQQALSTYNQAFSLRTVRLLMHLFNNSNVHRIGPKEFTAVFYSLQNWRAIFERFDRDRSGRIDLSELRDALLSLGFAVSPPVLDLLVSKFDKYGGEAKAIEYDNFIECCLTVKGLTEKFKEKDSKCSGSATFTYESFMLTVLPLLIA